LGGWGSAPLVDLLILSLLYINANICSGQGHNIANACDALACRSGFFQVVAVMQAYDISTGCCWVTQVTHGQRKSPLSDSSPQSLRPNKSRAHLYCWRPPPTISVLNVLLTGFDAFSRMSGCSACGSSGSRFCNIRLPSSSFPQGVS